MSTEIALPQSSVVAVKGDEIEVSARNPEEMGQAHFALIAWCDRKIATMKLEVAELTQATEEARTRKWKHTTLATHAALAKKRVTFYEKMKAALEVGFIIVPNFPVQVFAIRTENNAPRKYLTNYRHETHEQKAESLPPGVGEYKNPFPQVFQRDLTSGLSEDARKAGKTLIQFWAETWKDLEFPLTMAKPQIMQATGRAMALRIFDDIGILPAVHKNRDPMIIARIRDPRSTKYNVRFVSFIIAWHLDTAVL